MSEPSATKTSKRVSKAGRRFVETLRIGIFAAVGIAGCDAPQGRPPSFPTLGDDQMIRDIDTETEFGNAVIDLPGVGEVEVLYAVHDGLAMWTGDVLLGEAAELEQGFRAAAFRGPLWPNATLRYRIDPSLTPVAREALEQAAWQWAEKTGFRFAEAAPHETGGFIRLTSIGNGCYARLGYPGSGRTSRLNMGPGCERGNTALHELGHAIGLFHEQSRSDRDDHIRILWDNIQQGSAYVVDQFRQYSEQGLQGSDLGPYDFDSVMHYSSEAFAAGNAPTMVKKDGSLIRRSDDLSSGDIAAVLAMYAGEGLGGGSNSGGGIPDLPDPPTNTAGSCTSSNGNRYVAGACTQSSLCAPGHPNANASGWAPRSASTSCICVDAWDSQGGCPGTGATDPTDGPTDGPTDAPDGTAVATCATACGSSDPHAMSNGGSCYCDTQCVENGDCCEDYDALCGGTALWGSCEGFCGGAGSEGASCYCDETCMEQGDCCEDFDVVCQGAGVGPSCEGRCGALGDQGGCYCEPSCLEYGDCCADYPSQCDV